MKKSLLIASFLLISFASICQEADEPSDPDDQCAIVYHYDNTGFMILREYYCGDLTNVGGRPSAGGTKDTLKTVHVTQEIQPVTVLYPNPTTGKFKIRFGEALDNGVIYIVDVNGKILKQYKETGYLSEFDVSGFPAGTYFIRITNKGKMITQRVVKQ